MALPIRALWITSHYPNPANPVAGVFFRTQARALVRASVGVTVLATTPFAPQPLPLFADKWRQYHDTPKRLNDQGVQVEYPRYVATPRQVRTGIPDRFIFATLRQTLARKDFDLIHAHYSYPEGLAAVRLGTALDKPVIVTLHGDDASTYPDMNALARSRFKLTIAGASHVLAVSEKLADKTEEVTGRRPEMAPIGVELRRYTSLPKRTHARHALSLPDGIFVVLFIGFLEDRKGMAEITEALRSPGLRDVLCVVVGEGSWANSLQKLDNVRLDGPQPNDHIPNYLAAADLLILPSREEGTPTVVVEAGAAGLPVAATAVGGTTALLADDRGLLFQPRDADALATAITKVRSDLPSATARAARLKRFVTDRYDVDSTARGLAATYQAVVDRHIPTLRSGA